AEQVGLRWVIDEKMVEVVVKALTGGSTEMPKNWNRRFKHNRDKMKTGDILELAEVVRNLSLRDHEKGLSTGEKQMFVKAKKILASELMYAKDMDEEEAAEWLDDVLAGSSANGGTAGRTKTTTSAKPAKVASKTAAKHAARPVLDDAVIGRVVTALGEGWDGAVPALPIPDTVKRIDGERVVETLRRDELRVVQTPQAFVADVLRNALAGSEWTDCSAAVEAAGGRVRSVDGDPRLLKVTDADDLDRVAALL